MSTQNKKILFNIGWETDPNAVRKLELDAFKSLNSNPAALGTFQSPVDGTTTKSDVTLFLVRKRLIKLMESWNNILNSGLFIEARYNYYQQNTYFKLVGANLRSPTAEYLFKSNDNLGTLHFPLDFKTESIFYRMVRFLVACVNNHNWYMTNTTSKASYFDLTATSNVNGSVDMYLWVNASFNPTSAKFLATMEGFLSILKELISESKLVSALSINLDSLTYLTAAGRTNILALNAYKSNYKAIAKVGTGPSGDELNYLNPEPKALAQSWINDLSSKVSDLWPQFGTVITRNTESEIWSIRNVLVDTTDHTKVPEKFQTKYVACSQLDMKRPLVFNTQFINWSVDNDKPYIMLYNGASIVYIPDEIKNQDTVGTLGEQPDNQMNLTANFWSIGTVNSNDPNYDETSDVKLKLQAEPLQPLYDLDKLDYLDNLTLYLKLN